MFIRLLIFIIVAYVVYRAIKSWINPAASRPQVKSAGRTPIKADGVMIQDPQCGVYFSQRDAVPLEAGGKTLYFCSEECKESYRAKKGL